MTSFNSEMWDDATPSCVPIYFLSGLFALILVCTLWKTETTVAEAWAALAFFGSVVIAFLVLNMFAVRSRNSERVTVEDSELTVSYRRTIEESVRSIVDIHEIESVRLLEGSPAMLELIGSTEDEAVFLPSTERAFELISALCEVNPKIEVLQSC